MNSENTIRRSNREKHLSVKAKETKGQELKQCLWNSIKQQCKTNEQIENEITTRMCSKPDYLSFKSKLQASMKPLNSMYKQIRELIGTTPDDLRKTMDRLDHDVNALLEMITTKLHVIEQEMCRLNKAPSVSSSQHETPSVGTEASAQHITTFAVTEGSARHEPASVVSEDRAQHTNPVACTEGSVLRGPSSVNIEASVQHETPALANTEGGVRQGTPTVNTEFSVRSRRSRYSAASQSSVESAIRKARADAAALKAQLDACMEQQRLDEAIAQSKLEEANRRAELVRRKQEVERNKLQELLEIETKKAQDLERLNAQPTRSVRMLSSSSVNSLVSSKSYRSNKTDNEGSVYMKVNKPTEVRSSNEQYTPTTSKVPQSDIQLDVLKALTASRYPAPEPPVFSGNALHFPDWKIEFSKFIENRSTPDHEKISLNI